MKVTKKSEILTQLLLYLLGFALLFIHVQSAFIYLVVVNLAIFLYRRQAKQLDPAD